MASTDAPTITLPDGRSASYEEMQYYGEILQEFIRDQETKLATIEDVRRHNEIIDYLHLLADGYNEQLRLFRASQAQRENAVVILWGPAPEA